MYQHYYLQLTTSFHTMNTAPYGNKLMYIFIKYIYIYMER